MLVSSNTLPPLVQWRGDIGNHPSHVKWACGTSLEAPLSWSLNSFWMKPRLVTVILSFIMRTSAFWAMRTPPKQAKDLFRNVQSERKGIKTREAEKLRSSKPPKPKQHQKTVCSSTGPILCFEVSRQTGGRTDRLLIITNLDLDNNKTLNGSLYQQRSPSLEQM